ncbi:MAG: V4R domain-containing protein [Candidatus Hodarchaeota archaeon]
MSFKYHLDIRIKSSIHQNELQNSFAKMEADLPLIFQIETLGGYRDEVTAEFNGTLFYSAKFSPRDFWDAFWQFIAQEARKRLQLGENSSSIKMACIDAGKNMMASLTGTNPVKLGLINYIHVSNIQIRNFILLSLSKQLYALLIDLGKFAGKYGGFIGFIEEPVLKIRPMTASEHFQTAMRGLMDFYSRTSEMGLNITKKALIYEKGRSNIILRLFELPASTGIPEIGIPICYWDAGLIAGIVETIIGTPVYAEETHCWGLGDTFCDFHISLNENRQSTTILSSPISHCWSFYIKKILHFLIRNEHLSINEGRKIRNGISDYVHISLYQLFFSILAAIEDFGPFLLASAGKRHGRGLAAYYSKNKTLSLEKAFEFAQKLASGHKLLTAGHHDTEFLKDGIILHNHATLLEGKRSQNKDLYFYEAGFFSGLLSELTKTEIWLNMDVSAIGDGCYELKVDDSSS